MKAVLLFALVPMAIGLHVLLATKFGLYDRHTLIPLAIIVPTLGALAWILYATPATSLWVLNGTAWILLLFFLWWTRSYSSYAGEGQYRGAQNVASSLDGDLGLIDWQGNTFSLREAFGQHDALMLIFYRGVW